MNENLPEGWAENELPCCECKRFAEDGPLGPRCRKFNMPMSPIYHAIYETWDPCFEQKDE